VIEKVRQAAAVAHEDGIESETAAERMRVFMEASKLKPGTVRPYVAATRGYVEALNDGKDIEAFKVKANGETAPMTVAEAQRYIEERSLTDEEKQQRQANADLLAELVKRAKAAIADGDR